MRVGRHKIVRFPIRRTEVYCGENVQRIVEENTSVRCIRCGEQFLINRDTAYIPPDMNDCNVEMIRCPQCNFRASIYYYYAQTEKKRKRS